MLLLLNLTPQELLFTAVTLQDLHSLGLEPDRETIDFDSNKLSSLINMQNQSMNAELDELTARMHVVRSCASQDVGPLFTKELELCP